MNAINGAITAIFDLLLTPLEALGLEFSLIVVSGVFGILALIVFKHISWQRGIKETKNRIKGHMIEIRLYQNDLLLVSKAIGKVLLRNLQYLGLNFGPFVPLAVPFAFVIAQMVVRYGFAPVPVQEDYQHLLAGAGTTVRIELTADRKQDAADLVLTLPEGLVAASKLVPADGFAAQEFVATRPGTYELVITLDGKRYVKEFCAVARGPDPHNPSPRTLQPERGAGLFSAVLFPAEDTLPADSGIARVSFTYPDGDLGWLPLSGPTGVIVWFLIFSMAFGLILLKPLGVQI